MEEVEIIEFDKYAFVKISDTLFEYRFGSDDNTYDFVLPIQDIRRVDFKKRRTRLNNLGCNIFLVVLDLFSNNSGLVDLSGTNLDSNKKNAILILRYKTDEQKRWLRKEISWNGLNEQKAKKIKEVLKKRSKNLDQEKGGNLE